MRAGLALLALLPGNAQKPPPIHTNGGAWLQETDGEFSEPVDLPRYSNGVVICTPAVAELFVSQLAGACCTTPGACEDVYIIVPPPPPRPPPSPPPLPPADPCTADQLAAVSYCIQNCWDCNNRLTGSFASVVGCCTGTARATGAAAIQTGCQLTERQMMPFAVCATGPPPAPPPPPPPPPPVPAPGLPAGGGGGRFSCSEACQDRVLMMSPICGERELVERSTCAAAPPGISDRILLRVIF